MIEKVLKINDICSGLLMWLQHMSVSSLGLSLALYNFGEWWDESNFVIAFI